MKLCSYSANGKAGYGIVADNGIIALGERYRDSATLRQFLHNHGVGEAQELTGEPADLQLTDVTLKPVITDPDKIVCVGLNYHDHIKETGRTLSEQPVLFPRYAASQVGHGEAMIKPLESDKFDCEGELAVIIGTGGRRISEGDALKHIAGYACFNDGSIRDWQRHTHQFMPGKCFANSGSFGPWMVTTDEIPDSTTLTLTTRLNGEVMQHASCDLLIHTIPVLINYISTILPLVPGDVIVSGTPGGVGARRDPPVWMRDGDTIEVEVDGIGKLVNPIMAE